MRTSASSAAGSGRIWSAIRPRRAAITTASSSADHPDARFFNARAYGNPGVGAYGNAPRTNPDARFQFRKNVDLVLSKETAFRRQPARRDSLRDSESDQYREVRQRRHEQRRRHGRLRPRRDAGRVHEDLAVELPLSLLTLLFRWSTSARSFHGSGPFLVKASSSASADDERGGNRGCHACRQHQPTRRRPIGRLRGRLERHPRFCDLREALVGIRQSREQFAVPLARQVDLPGGGCCPGQTHDRSRAARMSAECSLEPFDGLLRSAYLREDLTEQLRRGLDGVGQAERRRQIELGPSG